MKDVVERLKEVAKLRAGESFPSEMLSDTYNWGEALSQLCADAVAEIERLRLAKLPDWARVALTSSSANITIVGNTEAASHES